MEIQVLNGQTLFDVAMQAAGSVEAAHEIARANGLNVTDELMDGARLTVPAVVDRQIVAYYRINAIKPATALPMDTFSGGVEFWRVEQNFIIE
ncbi:MAG: hypothetical protein LBD91_03155 [Prevotellaceae bacterium]|jgi:hypothetical protein|nr:hypothetical protein [Prevotellaceae bacterium]